MKRCPETGKIMWTRAEAIAARDRIVERKHQRPKSGGSVYKCQYCGTWHVTSARIDRPARLVGHRAPDAALLDLADLPLRVPQRVWRRG